jgi:hypothetical protein
MIMKPYAGRISSFFTSKAFGRTGHFRETYEGEGTPAWLRKIRIPEPINVPSMYRLS